MSFSQKKFLSLSLLNQKKKLAYSIRQYLDGRQPLSYISGMLGWYRQTVGSGIAEPCGCRDWQMLHERLVQEIESTGQYNDIRLFDGVADTDGNGIIILDNIRAPYNAGGIMRSAEAFHAAKVVMCGITPTTQNAKTVRSAMNVPIQTEYYERTIEAVTHYQRQGYCIIAVEKTQTSADISSAGELPPVGKRAIVLGNEEFGISEEVLSSSDVTVHIPLSGSKNSLNVCTAAGIAMYCLLNDKFV